jgi:hypothetical protein
MQTQDNKNQPVLFHEDIHDTYNYYKPVKFHGAKLENGDQKELNNQIQFLVKNYCNGEFWNTLEWVTQTGIAGVDRLLRHIANGEVAGYTREEIKLGKRHWKYRIVKK